MHRLKTQTAKKANRKKLKRTPSKMSVTTFQFSIYWFVCLRHVVAITWVIQRTQGNKNAGGIGNALRQYWRWTIL